MYFNSGIILANKIYFHKILLLVRRTFISQLHNIQCLSSCLFLLYSCYKIFLRNILYNYVLYVNYAMLIILC